MSVIRCSEKWSDCIGCPHNDCKKNSKLNKNDYQMFTCTADPEVFACPRIPELYPEKLYNINKYDGIENLKKVQKNKNEKEQVLEPFLIELYDSIESTIRSIVIIGDDIDHISKYFKKILKKRNYRHIQVFNIRRLNNIFEGYDVFAVPKSHKKIVYPEVDITMNHGLKKVKIKEMVMDLKHFPCFSSKREDANIKMNMNLSDFSVIENNEENLDGSQSKENRSARNKKRK